MFGVRCHLRLVKSFARTRPGAYRLRLTLMALITHTPLSAAFAAEARIACISLLLLLGVLP